MSANQSTYIRVINIAIVLALVVIVLGAYTRLTDSGLGCPDWPGCYGNLSVPDDVSQSGFERPLEKHKAWNEMLHRYVAGTLGIIILLILILAIKGRNTHKQSLGLPFLITATVFFQAALGMWTVTLLLSPAIVTAHLIGGFATLSLLWLLRLKQNYPKTLTNHPTVWLKIMAMLGLLLLMGQIILGGWVSTNYAALACGTDFPTCAKVWWPEMDFYNGFDVTHVEGKDYEFGVLDSAARTAIQVTHRIGALIVFIYLSILGFVLFKNDLGRYAVILFVVLLCQLSLGIMNVVLGLPLSVAVLHNLVAALLLLTVISITYRLVKARRWNQ